jgi:hypothetical protein
MAKLLSLTEERIYSPHALLYSDPAYLFSRGQLDLEDPTLAGVRLGYPVWSALVFQSVVSALLNSPPAYSWVWGNLIWLLLICGFAAGVVKELGGGRLAQSVAGVWLLLGTNPIGYVLLALLPSLGPLRLFGDVRYTPWVSKFYLFSTMPLGLGLIAALLWLFIRPGALTKSVIILSCLLVSATGVLYPLLLPPALAIVGSKGLALLVESLKTIRQPIPTGALFALGAVILIAALASYMEVRFLEEGRQFKSPPLSLSTPQGGMRKAVAGVVATSVLLFGMAFTLRKCYQSKPGPTVMLLTAALACFLLHALFSISYWDNEYKFIFVAAMCLASFPALATERFWLQWPRPRALAVLGILACLLLLPFLHRYYAKGWRHINPNQEVVDTNSFYLRLTPQHPWFAVCEAVRTLTPSDSVVAVEYSGLYLPAVINRSLYVAPANRSYHGVNLAADVLLARIRRNGSEILTQRRNALQALFESPDTMLREEALGRILALGRPVTIIAEQQHTALLEWLRHRGRGSPVYEREGITVWVVQPDHS